MLGRHTLRQRSRAGMWRTRMQRSKRPKRAADRVSGCADSRRVDQIVRPPASRSPDQGRGAANPRLRSRGNRRMSQCPSTAKAESPRSDLRCSDPRCPVQRTLADGGSTRPSSRPDVAPMHRRAAGSFHRDRPSNQRARSTTASMRKFIGGRFAALLPPRTVLPPRQKKKAKPADKPGSV